MDEPIGVRVVRTRCGYEALDVHAEPFVEKHLLIDDGSKLDDALFRQTLPKPHTLKIEVHQLRFLLRAQVTDVHHDGESIGGRLGERKRALPELDWIHRGEGKDGG